MMLLDTLALLPGATPSQLAHALSANRSLVYRMLQTLLDRGFVAKDSSNGYRLGPRLLYLGQQAEKGTALMDASRDVLDQLLEETRENVYLIVREGMDMLCLATRISPQPIRLSAEVGTKGGLHTGGAAKMLLAHSPPDVIDAVIDRHLAEFVPATMRTREQIIGVLEKIRRDGFYEAIGELNPDIYTLTAAIRDGTGTVGAVLSIAGPTARLDAASRPKLLKGVREAAARISARLGR